MRDIFDENIWFACNEALGKFLDLNEFRAQAEQAKRLPSFRAKFENLRLNKRIDANVQFISDADWMACAGPLDMPALAGKPCYAGLDLSTRRTCRRWCCTGRTTAPCCRSSGCLKKACSIAIARKAGIIALGAMRDCWKRPPAGDQFQGDHPSAGRDQRGVRSRVRRL